jgi:ribosomal protein S7
MENELELAYKWMAGEYENRPTKRTAKAVADEIEEFYKEKGQVGDNKGETNECPKER